MLSAVSIVRLYYALPFYPRLGQQGSFQAKPHFRRGVLLGFEQAEPVQCQVDSSVCTAERVTTFAAWDRAQSWRGTLCPR